MKNNPSHLQVKAQRRDVATGVLEPSLFPDAILYPVTAGELQK